MNRSDGLESALRRDRLIVLAALAGIVALTWAGMVRDARGMSQTGVCRCLGMAMSGPDVKTWSRAAIAPLFLMWAQMMVAMMIPTAAPVILTFALVNRQRRERDRPFAATGWFVCGYLVVWCAFSFAIALAQWALHGAALLSPMMASTSPTLGGVLLIAAGIFQWTPWKRACLNHCRSPLEFLLGGWHEGRLGALRMGIQHGIYCTGCCWLLMALLFVAGVMNLWWVAAITLLVLAEKALPQGLRLGSFAGLVFLAWGAWMIGSRWL
jgi:predicted metal-binding membrane protein